MKLDRKLSLLILLAATTALFAQECDVSKWVEIPCPKNSKSKEGVLWDYRASQSTNKWHIYRDGQKVCAVLAARANKATEEIPQFKVEEEHFDHASATIKVSDGWLVGFNRGEWGGALYWFSSDGTNKYRISKNRVVDFIKSDDQVFAIVAGGYMSYTSPWVGLIISISQSSNQGPWQMSTMCRLPQSPCAIVQHPDKSLLVVLDDSFVSATPDGKIRTIVKEAHWANLAPNTMVLSEDSKTAFIGMHQFVAKVTLKNGRVSFLVPDRSFLNEQLPKGW
jgi:hypothetical protein